MSAPTNNTIIFLQNSNGQYAGKFNKKGDRPELVQEAQSWEKWILIQHGDKWSLKQEVSGLFLGGTKNHKEQPFLAPKDDAWEKFVIEPRGNGGYSFRNIDNNFLSTDKHRLIFDKDFDARAVWKIKPLQDQAPIEPFPGLPAAGEIVTLVSANGGGYIGGPGETGQEVCIVGAAKASEDFEFEVRIDKCCLKQVVNNLYLGLTCEAGQVVQRVGAASWNEYFHLINLGDGLVAFRNLKGNFLSKQDKKLVFSSQLGPSEHWRFAPRSAIQNPQPAQQAQQTQQTQNSQQTKPIYPVIQPGQPIHRTISLQYFPGLPSNFDKVTLTNANGGYIGGVKQQDKDILVMDQAHDYEDLIFEIIDDKVALKQVVSGLYLGKNSELDQPVQWAPQLLKNELFEVQNLGASVVAFKNYRGLYLSKNQDKRLVLKNKLTQSEQWKFMPCSELLKKGINNLNQNSGVTTPSAWGMLKKHSQGGEAQWNQHLPQNSQHHQQQGGWSQGIMGSKQHWEVNVSVQHHPQNPQGGFNNSNNNVPANVNPGWANQNPQQQQAWGQQGGQQGNNPWNQQQGNSQWGQQQGNNPWGQQQQGGNPWGQNK